MFTANKGLVRWTRCHGLSRGDSRSPPLKTHTASGSEREGPRRKAVASDVLDACVNARFLQQCVVWVDLNGGRFRLELYQLGRNGTGRCNGKFIVAALCGEHDRHRI